MNTVIFSPDGEYLATGDSDGTARVWEAATGQEVARMVYGAPVSAPVVVLAFSLDGKYLAAGRLDDTARVYEVPSGREVGLITPGSYVWAVAFSPDGKYLATGSEDGTARVWEMLSGREVARVTHVGRVLAVSFSPDGKYLATASAVGTPRSSLWRAEDMIAEACGRLTRNLTLAEWQQHLADEPYHATCPNLLSPSAVPTFTP